MDYTSLATSYLSGGAGAAGGGGNSSSLKASQDSTFGFTNNADFTVGNAKPNNMPVYIVGGIAAIALLVVFMKK